MRKPIYFDYAATTPMDPQVADAMAACLTVDGNFGNPASRSHLYGWKAEEAVENARSQVAELIGAESREIVWTSGATESNNLAIKGWCEACAKTVPKLHIITSAIEHKAVLDNCVHLQKQGVSITYLQPEIAPAQAGLISPDAVIAAITDNTVLISIMMVNNEIGVINDIRTLGEKLLAVNRTRKEGAKILLHVDAAQAAGKMHVDVNAQHIDLLSLSAHKMYGPKGIGALYVRRAAHIQVAAQIHGGGHERNMRSGTLPTHQIVGMGTAAQLAKAGLVEERQRLRALRDRFLEGIKRIPAVYINGTLENRVPGNLNVRFAYVDGESLLMALRDIAVSTGSACTSASVEPSYVLKALGVEDSLAHASLRISLGRYTTEEEIDFAADYLGKTLAKLRANNPAWKTFLTSPENANQTA